MHGPSSSNEVSPPSRVLFNDAFNDKFIMNGPSSSNEVSPPSRALFNDAFNDEFIMSGPSSSNAPSPPSRALFNVVFHSYLEVLIQGMNEVFLTVSSEFTSSSLL